MTSFSTNDVDTYFFLRLVTFSSPNSMLYKPPLPLPPFLHFLQLPTFGVYNSRFIHYTSYYTHCPLRTHTLLTNEHEEITHYYVWNSLLLVLHHIRPPDANARSHTRFTEPRIEINRCHKWAWFSECKQ